MRLLLPALTAAMAIAAQNAWAQPANMRWKLDAPARLASGDQPVADSTWRFEPMAPGWHVTAGPGVLLYDPTQGAEGQFSIESQMFLFPNPPDEGIGVFVGGRELESERSSCLLFLIRRDGQYSIAEQSGNVMRTIRAWTADTSIAPHPGGSEVILNRIRVGVTPDSVTLTINQKRVTAIPRAGLHVEGQFGIRIGARANVHVTTLDHTKHLAPMRGGARP